jgi:hypothetical protein
MASKIEAAIEKLLQFGSHTQPDAPISRKELTPFLAAIADALVPFHRDYDSLTG